MLGHKEKSQGKCINSNENYINVIILAKIFIECLLYAKRFICINHLPITITWRELPCDRWSDWGSMWFYQVVNSRNRIPVQACLTLHYPAHFSKGSAVPHSGFQVSTPSTGTRVTRPPVGRIRRPPVVQHMETTLLGSCRCPSRSLATTQFRTTEADGWNERSGGTRQADLHIKTKTNTNSEKEKAWVPRIRNTCIAVKREHRGLLLASQKTSKRHLGLEDDWGNTTRKDLTYKAWLFLRPQSHPCTHKPFLFFLLLLFLPPSPLPPSLFSPSPSPSPSVRTLLLLKCSYMPQVAGPCSSFKHLWKTRLKCLDLGLNWQFLYFCPLHLEGKNAYSISFLSPSQDLLLDTICSARTWHSINACWMADSSHLPTLSFPPLQHYFKDMLQSCGARFKTRFDK